MLGAPPSFGGGPTMRAPAPAAPPGQRIDPAQIPRPAGGDEPTNVRPHGPRSCAPVWHAPYGRVCGCLGLARLTRQARCVQEGRGVVGTLEG